MSDKKLNDMKVAARLLDARVDEEMAADGGWESLAREAVTALSDIARELGEAPYLFRDGAVIHIADVLRSVADMEDLYEGDSREQG